MAVKAQTRVPSAAMEMRADGPWGRQKSGRGKERATWGNSLSIRSASQVAHDGAPVSENPGRFAVILASHFLQFPP